MSGLDDGRLLAYLDGELEPGDRADVESWLEESAEAREALGAVRARRAMVSGALTALGPSPTLVEEARSRVAARLELRGVGATAPTTGWLRRRDLARAALLVLFLGAAGASAAVPGSPVRSWLESVLDREEPTAALVAGEEALDAEADDDMGLRVLPEDGRLEVTLSGVPAGRDIEVRLVDGPRGAVYAPRASFRSGSGRIDAAIGEGRRAVRVEIPRGVASATVRVDGRPYLEKRGERLEFPGPEARVSGDVIRFRADAG